MMNSNKEETLSTQDSPTCREKSISKVSRNEFEPEEETVDEEPPHTIWESITSYFSSSPPKEESTVMEMASKFADSTEQGTQREELDQVNEIGKGDAPPEVVPKTPFNSGKTNDTVIHSQRPFDPAVNPAFDSNKNSITDSPTIQINGIPNSSESNPQDNNEYISSIAPSVQSPSSMFINKVPDPFQVRNAANVASEIHSTLESATEDAKNERDGEFNYDNEGYLKDKERIQQLQAQIPPEILDAATLMKQKAELPYPVFVTSWTEEYSPVVPFECNNSTKGTVPGENETVPGKVETRNDEEGIDKENMRYMHIDTNKANAMDSEAGKHGLLKPSPHASGERGIMHMTYHGEVQRRPPLRK